MKQILLTAFVWLQLLAFNHAQTYQDTTFTDPVVVSFAPDFVTFKNCRFVGIDGVALYIEGSGVLVSDCTFEDINSTAILAFGGEVYLTSDTFSQISGSAIIAEFGAMIVLDCSFSDISRTAIRTIEADVTEVSGSTIRGAEKGIYVSGIEGVSEVLVANNHLGRIGIDSLDTDGTAIQVSVAASVKILENTIDSCYGRGIYLNNGAIGSAELQGNQISYINGHGIYGDNDVYNGLIKLNQIAYTGYWGGFLASHEAGIYWKGPDARIEQNHIHHNTDAECALGLNCGAGIILGNTATVSRNLIHDSNGDGIIYQSEVEAGQSPLSVYNNQVYDVANRTLVYLGDFSDNQPENTIIRNNTLHSKSAPNLLMAGVSKSLQLEGNILIVENNPLLSSYVSYSGGTVLTDQFNLKAPGDLGFVNFAGRDFHLADETSPAHKIIPQNFGLPNDDYDGELRLGLRDAGADELNAEGAICGCNNCPSVIEDFFTGDFTFSVISAANNDLSSTAQGVCGVRVEFEHEYLGDLSMELISPAGQKVQLIGPSGFFGGTEGTKWNIGFTPCLYPANPDPGFSAVWASNQLWGQSGSYSGIYYPATGCLENFDEGTVTGDWTLRVFDNQSSDGGTVLGFEVMFCNEEGVGCFLCSGPPVAGLNVSNVGSWGITLESATTGAPTAYQIDFGDGQTGISLPAFHEYQSPGAYLVRLIASNECGQDTTYVPVQVFGGPPVAFAFVDPEEGCAPLTVQAHVIQEDHVDNWHWFFPGGVPSESFEKEPTVVFPQVGIYTISLEISNALGTTEIPEIATLVLTDSLLNPSFNVQVVSNVIQVTNTTQGAGSFFWSINGGDPVGLNTSPFLFEVDSTGTYQITLSATNDCGVAIKNTSVPVIITGVDQLSAQGWKIQASPNPTSGLFQLQVEAPNSVEGTIQILNTLGQIVAHQSVVIQTGQNNIPLDLTGQPAGAYQIRLQTTLGSTTLRIIMSE